MNTGIFGVYAYGFWFSISQHYIHQLRYADMRQSKLITDTSLVSQSFTHALLNLATYPQYCTPLREEASVVINEDGWTKTAMTKLVKMDSFLKESQRFNSTTLCKLLFIFDDTKLISASPYDAQSNAAIRILGWYRDTQWNTRRRCFIAHASRRGILSKRL